MTNQEISENLGKPVLYNGEQHILTAYILRFKNGKRIKQCEIQDNQNSNSVMVVKAEQLQTI